MPTLVNQDGSSVTRSRRRLSQLLGRQPSDEEVASDLGWTVRRVGVASSTLFRPLSLDLPFGKDGDATIADFISNPNERSPLEEAIVNDSADIWVLLQSLPQRHELVLRRRFGIGDGDPQTLAQVSATLGITREACGSSKYPAPWAGFAAARATASATTQWHPPGCRFDRPLQKRHAIPAARSSDDRGRTRAPARRPGDSG